MPYFIYAVAPFAQLEQLGQCATFPEASATARRLRAQEPAASRRRIRIMFAEDATAAEDLLLQVRDAPPEGDE
jgi:hypothetical protein